MTVSPMSAFGILTVILRLELDTARSSLYLAPAVPATVTPPKTSSPTSCLGRFHGISPTARNGELNLAVPDRRIQRCKREHYCIQTRGSEKVLVSLKCDIFVLCNDNVKSGGGDIHGIGSVSKG